MDQRESSTQGAPTWRVSRNMFCNSFDKWIETDYQQH